MPGSEQPTSEIPTPPQAISDAFWAAAELDLDPLCSAEQSAWSYSPPSPWAGSRMPLTLAPASCP
jgi:hypothetical protein